jgi:hypothetical protein
MLKVSDAVNGKFINVVEDDFDFNRFGLLETFLFEWFEGYYIVDFRVVFEEIGEDIDEIYTGHTMDGFLETLRNLEKRTERNGKIELEDIKITFDFLLSRDFELILED